MRSEYMALRAKQHAQEREIHRLQQKLEIFQAEFQNHSTGKYNGDAV